MIEEVSIEIGGQTIDKHYGSWLNIWNELTQTSEKYDGYEVMVGNTILLTASSNTSTPQTLIRVPLQFWS